MRLPRTTVLKSVAASVFALTLAVAHAAPGDAAVRSAYAAYQANNAARLAEAVRDVPAAHPLATYVEYWRLEQALPGVDDAAIRAYLAANDGSRTAELLRAEWLKSLGTRAAWAPFLAEFARLQKPDPSLVCHARYAELVSGDMRRLKDAVALWFSGRDLPNACTPLFDRLFALGALNTEDAWRRLRLALDAGKVNVARVVAARLPESQFDPGRLDSAARNPAAMLANVPEAPSRDLREIAIYAIEQRARSDTDQAADAVERWSPRFTDVERRAAWGAVATWAARRHEARALAAFAQAGPVVLSDAQREWWVRAALRAGDWASVGGVIDAMGAARELPEWRYWRARALKQLGQLLPARQLLLSLVREPHYYGQLAQEELGPTLNQPRVNVKPGGDEIAAVAGLPGVRRALALNELGWRSEAIAEWNFTVLRLPDDRQKLAAAEIARRADWYDRAIFAAEQTVDNHDFELRFIAPYRELAQAASRNYGLDEAWVFGLMRQESRFINVAKSSVGAAGLMQIMPATARWIADKLGAGRAQADNMNDPETNIRFGAFYLAHLQRQLDGSPVLVTAGYNAGPGRAQRWRGATALEGAVYVESIPFAETRDYVKKVLSNAMYYAARFNQPSVLLVDRLGRIPPRSK